MLEAAFEFVNKSEPLFGVQRADLGSLDVAGSDCFHKVESALLVFLARLATIEPLTGPSIFLFSATQPATPKVLRYHQDHS